MHIEVDQSGKVEDLRQDTVVAFSNSDWAAVRLPRKIKRTLFIENKQQVRKIVQKIFAICLFYLLEPHVKHAASVMICREYCGWEYFIKRELLQYLNNKELDHDAIQFGFIGKHSEAHKKALKVNRKELEPSRILSKEEILKYLK